MQLLRLILAIFLYRQLPRRNLRIMIAIIIIDLILSLTPTFLLYLILPCRLFAWGVKITSNPHLDVEEVCHPDFLNFL